MHNLLDRQIAGGPVPRTFLASCPDCPPTVCNAPCRAYRRHGADRRCWGFAAGHAPTAGRWSPDLDLLAATANTRSRTSRSKVAYLASGESSSLGSKPGTDARRRCSSLLCAASHSDCLMSRPSTVATTTLFSVSRVLPSTPSRMNDGTNQQHQHDHECFGTVADEFKHAKLSVAKQKRRTVVFAWLPWWVGGC